jgi:hypothetical protein
MTRALSYPIDGQYLAPVVLRSWPTCSNPPLSIQNFQSESKGVLMLDSQSHPHKQVAAVTPLGGFARVVFPGPGSPLMVIRDMFRHDPS